MSKKEKYIQDKAIQNFKMKLNQKLLSKKEKDLLRVFKKPLYKRIPPIMQNIKKGQTVSSKDQLEELISKLPNYYNTYGVKEYKGEQYLEVWIQFDHRWEYDKFEFGDFEDEDEYEYYYDDWAVRGNSDAQSEIENFNNKFPNFIMKKVGRMGDKGQTDFKITVR